MCAAAATPQSAASATPQSASQAAPKAAPQVAPHAAPPVAPHAAPQPTTPSAAPTEPPRATPHLSRAPATLAAPSRVADSNPAIMRLAHEEAALELVDSSAKTALQDAIRRIAAMHAFIEIRGATADFAAFTQGFHTSASQISFQQANDAALDHLGRRVPAPSTTDLQQMETAVQVASASAHQSFNQLNAARRSVEMLAIYLKRAGLLAAYQEWAAAHPASIAHNARGNRAAAKPAADAAANPAADSAAAEPALAQAHGEYSRDIRAVQGRWDAAQLAGNPLEATPPAEAPSLAVAHGPYATTWWNSYADPYYDIAGTPEGATGTEPLDGWATPGYARTNAPVYAETRASWQAK